MALSETPWLSLSTAPAAPSRR